LGPQAPHGRAREVAGDPISSQHAPTRGPGAPLAPAPAGDLGLGRVSPREALTRQEEANRNPNGQAWELRTNLPHLREQQKVERRSGHRTRRSNASILILARRVRDKAAKMATATLEDAIAELQAAAAKQGDVVRSLKAHAKDGKADKVQARPGGRLAATPPAVLPCPHCARGRASPSMRARRRTWMPRSRSCRRSSCPWTASRRCVRDRCSRAARRAARRPAAGHRGLTAAHAAAPGRALPRAPVQRNRLPRPDGRAMPLAPAAPRAKQQEYEKSTGKVSSQSKEAFRAALVRTWKSGSSYSCRLPAGGLAAVAVS
jgi:hypothetical protein